MANGSIRRGATLSLWPCAVVLVSCGGPPVLVTAPTLASAPSTSPARKPDEVPSAVIGQVPPDAHAIDVNFENKAHLIAYRFDPAVAPPGTPVKITLYWRCDDAMDDGWQLLTHIQNETTGKTSNLDFVGPLRVAEGGRQRLGPDRWEPGKIYVDAQPYTVPSDAQGAELTVYAGIWRGDARLRIVSGANDGDNRAVVGKIETGLARPAPVVRSESLPAMTAYKLAPNESIRVDGAMTEPAWQQATATGALVDPGTGTPSVLPVGAVARLAWDDNNLYVFFHVTDSDLLGGVTTPTANPREFTVTGQPKLWMKECVEMMFEPGESGDNRDYYEIQVSTQNKVFHSQYDTYNQPRTEPDGPFGHEDWNPGLRSAVRLRGTLDKPADHDDGYDVEAAIPWASFTKAPRHPPAPGDVWRVNLYAMKFNSGVAWSPILGQGSFHKASRFGRVTWAVRTP